jgi:prepilin-type N-terminal cleavage/methylation domain-containing protein
MRRLIKLSQTKFSKGFTLVELLVVIAIIGILAAIGVPMYQGYISEVRAKDAQNTLQSIAMEQKSYFSKHFCFYVTGTGDNAASINTGLFGSELGADGPIPITNNQYSFEITGSSSGACSGTNALTFTAKATHKTDYTKIFSITDTLKKTDEYFKRGF